MAEVYLKHPTSSAYIRLSYSIEIMRSLMFGPVYWSLVALWEAVAAMGIGILLTYAGYSLKLDAQLDEQFRPYDLADPFMASIWACGLLWVGISFGVVPLRAASLERQGWQRQP